MTERPRQTSGPYPAWYFIDPEKVNAGAAEGGGGGEGGTDTLKCFRGRTSSVRLSNYYWRAITFRLSTGWLE